MTSVIEKIISSFKSMLDKMEQEGRRIVQELKSFSADAAREIEIRTTEIFRGIKQRFALMIQLFKSKLESYTKRSPNTALGPHASTFSTKLRNTMKTAEKEVEKFAKDFKNETVALLTEAKDVVKRMADGLKTSVEDIGEVTKRASEDLVKALATIGESAVKKTEAFVGDVTKSFEVDAKFVYNHGVKVAGAAAITAFDPVLIIGLAVSAGILVGAHSYAESTSHVSGASHVSGTSKS